MKMMPGIGPAHGAHSRPVATPRITDDQTLSCWSIPLLRHAGAERHEWTRQSVRDTREDERNSEQRQERQGGPAADSVGAQRPSAADRGQRRHEREGAGHAREQRQGGSHEGPIGARENQRKHREDAGADNRQESAKIGEEGDQ